MTVPFSRTLRALESDGFHGSWCVLASVLVLLAAWLAWFFYGNVTRYEVTAQARLEVDQVAHPVASPVLARVITSNLVLGREVHEGDVLLELDANSERLQVQEERTHLADLASQIASLRTQAEAMEQARNREQQTMGVGTEAASARFGEADAIARLAESESKRLDQLHDAGLIPQREFEQGKFEAERRRNAANSLRLEADRAQHDRRTHESDRTVQLENVRGQILKLEHERTTTEASIQRLQYEVERRIIRAPVTGRLAEVAPLAPGAVVDEGDQVGAIVPAGRLRAIAQFPPQAALGRIRPGQHARVRLDGFPWTEYGSIQATVSTVASEIRDGTVRVEMSIDQSPRFSVPLQHGLPGSAEVEVERLSPAVLTLRAAGQLITTPRSVFAQAR